MGESASTEDLERRLRTLERRLGFAPTLLEALAREDGPPFYRTRSLAELLGVTRQWAATIAGTIHGAHRDPAGWIIPRAALARYLAEVFHEHGGPRHPALRVLQQIRDGVEEERLEVPPVGRGSSADGERFEVRPGEIAVRCRSVKEFSEVALAVIREARSDRQAQTAIERGLRRKA